MDVICRRNATKLLFVFTCCAPFFFAPPALGAWYLLDLNTKQTTIIPGRATAINDAGQVTGYIDTRVGSVSANAFITGPNGHGVTILGSLGGRDARAYGINNDGRVVGSSSIGTTGGITTHAFITGPNGERMRDLGTLGGPYGSEAQGINSAGQVAGHSAYDEIGFNHAFITGPDGEGMRDLGTLGGDLSIASAINDAGQVTGWAEVSRNSLHAFITDPNRQGMRDLGTLGGSSSAGRDINEAGQVAGDSSTSAGATHAFITGPNGQGMRDLGTLGGVMSFAEGINDAGQVVGSYDLKTSNRRAFVTGLDGEDMMDLSSQFAGMQFSHATMINNAGQVIAFGFGPVPIPEAAPYVTMLAGLGLIAFLRCMRRQ